VGGRQTILVVDDDAAIREVVAEVLEEEGYQVTVASSGQDALAAIDADEPALVVLDMRMPVMNGWEFAEQLGERPGRRIPLLVMTAAVDADKRAAEIGAAGTLSKPFDLSDLIELVQTLIETPAPSQPVPDAGRG
jgi:CheY-like chemotaxis protein